MREKRERDERERRKRERESECMPRARHADVVACNGALSEQDKAGGETRRFTLEINVLFSIPD